MKRSFRILSLIAVLSGLTAAAHAQIVVWSQNFDAEPLGAYGAHTTDFGSSPPANITNSIVNTNASGPISQAMRIAFDVGNTGNLNMQTATLEYPASGNTNTVLSNYTLEFDLAVEGQTFGGGFFEIGVFGPGSWIFGGDAIRIDPGNVNLPAAGSGYKHFSYPFSAFSGSGSTPLVPTDSAFSVGFGFLAFPDPLAAGRQLVYVDNIQITMITNPPPLPRPTMNILTAKPALRIFGQNFAQTYNQEGFGTVDTFQSWVGATPSLPKSYSITFADFDTVDNYSLYAQFVPNNYMATGPSSPFVVFVGTNALVWRITHVATGFTTGIDWKTNAPNAGTPNNALTMTTTTTNGRGTWTLTFTSDTDGTVRAPDGTTGSFSLPPAMAAQFADPLTILFGTAPNNTLGYGQYIDISRITITNVLGLNEDDDFTKDDTLNTGLWNPAFSLDPGSVIQVSTSTPFWVNWTVPDTGFGLGTKASLTDTNIPWYTPGYYSGGAVTLTPRQMGPTLKWVLIPNTCLPTLDGFPFGTPAPEGFFRLSNPPPIQ